MEPVQFYNSSQQVGDTAFPWDRQDEQNRNRTGLFLTGLCYLWILVSLCWGLSRCCACQWVSCTVFTLCTVMSCTATCEPSVGVDHQEPLSPCWISIQSGQECSRWPQNQTTRRQTSPPFRSFQSDRPIRLRQRIYQLAMYSSPRSKD